MKRKKTMLSFFKPIGSSADSQIQTENPNVETDNVQVEAPIDHVENLNNQSSDAAAAATPIEAEAAEHQPIVASAFERDPGKRVQIWELPPDEQDKARRFYISEGPYQPILADYPLSELSHRRRFQSSWFKQFTWLEYSPHTDCAYCLPCFLFSKKPIGKSGSDSFIVKGFQNWKKVNNGKECSFLKHMGDASSAHNYSVRCFSNLKNTMAQIDTVMVKQNEILVAAARLRFGTTIDCIR
jgi:hypothetical protein